MTPAAWTFTATGLALGLIGLVVVLAAWWTEADRNDATDLQLADHEQQLGNLHILVAEHLGLEMEPEPTPQPRATVERVIGDRTFTFREDQR